MVRVPKRPLSITASALWICGPVTGHPPWGSWSGAAASGSWCSYGAGLRWKHPGRERSRGPTRGPLPRTGRASPDRGPLQRGCGHLFSCERRRSGPAAGRPLPTTGPSSTQTELLDQLAIAGDVLLGQVVEQPAALADEQQQTAAAVVVVLVLLEVFSEVVDAVGQHRHLDLRRAGVVLGATVLGHDLLLGGSVDRHSGSFERSLRGAPGQVLRGTLDPRPF